MKETWKFVAKERKGKRHREKNMLIQDKVSCHRSGSKFAMALTDGVGKTDLNILASEKIVEWVVDFLLENYKDICMAKEEDVTYTIMLHVNQIIHDLVEQYRVDRNEFASTVLGVCVDTEAKNLLAIHLGDGMIIVQGKSTRILSSCENGVWSNQTYLTTSHNASEKVRVYKENIQGIDDIALISDGMYQLPMDDRQLDAIFCNLDADEELEEGMDDKAIIALRRKNG